MSIHKKMIYDKTFVVLKTKTINFVYQMQACFETKSIIIIDRYYAPTITYVNIKRKNVKEQIKPIFNRCSLINNEHEEYK